MGSKHGKQAAGLFNCFMLANEVDFNIQHKSIREEKAEKSREVKEQMFQTHEINSRRAGPLLSGIIGMRPKRVSSHAQQTKTEHPTNSNPEFSSCTKNTMTTTEPIILNF
jgi:hypothetical protein